MTEVTLSVDQLIKSKSNVRHKHSKDDIVMMANSIKARGIINPPAVAKDGEDKWEIVAGGLRILGAKAACVEQIRCLDVSALTDKERVDISLSENVHRRGMTAIQYYAAFNQLFKAGMTVNEIASRFDKKEREVQQLLAIGSLPKKILDLAEKNVIGDRTLKALAIAPGKDIVRYTKLKLDQLPNDWDIQNWLAGSEGMFMAKYAIFDLDEYVGPKMTDLFAEEDEVWLLDGAEFWRLQQKMIDIQLNEMKKIGWDTEEVDYFQAWMYDKTAKAKGGKVIYAVDQKTGAVEFHKGYKRKPKAGKAPTPTGKPEKKADTSKAFDNFMAETRHAAVQRHMIDGNRAGLVGTLILLLKQCDNVVFRNGGKPLSDGYNDSLHSSDNFIVVHDDYREMLSELGIKNGHTWDIKILSLGPKLMEYTPATLQRWIILTVAHNWHCEGKSGDEIGKVTGLTQVNTWEHDDAFWNGINNRNTLLKIAKDNKITLPNKSTMKGLRAVLKKTIKDSWRPDWLKF